jgi:Membrane bound beta barrel domain (DUF5777)
MGTVVKRFLFFIICCTGIHAVAQDVDLSKMLDEESEKEDKDKTEKVYSTFKSTRLINGHSVENTYKGVLDLKISHRFGTVNKGLYEFFGFDNASMRWGFDYGLTNRLMIGFGRSSFQKQYDAFVKYKLLWQSTGKNKMPVSVNIISTAMVQTLKWEDTTRKNYFSSRLFFAHQLLIGRKFSENFSLQVMPSMVHYNLVKRNSEPNDLFAIGIGGRQKITKRISINAEYYYQLPGYKLANTKNSLSIGFDIETGGHVFQLHFTNSTGMTERTFITETSGSWDKGDILFGFNISRVFTIKKAKAK